VLEQGIDLGKVCLPRIGIVGIGRVGLIILRTGLLAVFGLTGACSTTPPMPRRADSPSIVNGQGALRASAVRRTRRTG
jgi:hypothetical protein